MAISAGFTWLVLAGVSGDLLSEIVGLVGFDLGEALGEADSSRSHADKTKVAHATKTQTQRRTIPSTQLKCRLFDKGQAEVEAEADDRDLPAKAYGEDFLADNKL